MGMKKFLIIGNTNAVTYKEIFHLINENKMWLGVSLNMTKCHFIVPQSYEGSNVFYENGNKMAKVNNAIWFTNLDHAKRHTELDLYKKYNAESYPKYDNYDAINVDRVVDIPEDYDGEMGVPISFLNKLNRNQFEITGIMHSWDKGEPSILGKLKYSRLLIKRKK